MGRKTIGTLFGGGCEIDLIAEEGVKHLTVKLKVEVPIEEAYPHHGSEKHNGWLHVDLSDAKDLRDALTVWLEENGVK